MADIILDTCAYSAFMKGNISVNKWIQESENIFLNPIIIGELKAGFIQGLKSNKNVDQLDSFLETPRVNILSIDEDTSERYAIILKSLRKVGTPIPTNDIWIAATAMQYGLFLITTDKHFINVVQVIVKLIKI